MSRWLATNEHVFAFKEMFVENEVKLIMMKLKNVSFGSAW